MARRLPTHSILAVLLLSMGANVRAQAAGPIADVKLVLSPGHRGDPLLAAQATGLKARGYCCDSPPTNAGTRTSTYVRCPPSGTSTLILK